MTSSGSQALTSSTSANRCPAITESTSRGPPRAADRQSLLLQDLVQGAVSIVREHFDYRGKLAGQVVEVVDRQNPIDPAQPLEPAPRGALRHRQRVRRPYRHRFDAETEHLGRHIVTVSFHLVAEEPGDVL